MCACRAISQLLPEANKEVIQPHLMSLFSSLMDLLNQALDDATKEAIKQWKTAAVFVEPIQGGRRHIWCNKGIFAVSWYRLYKGKLQCLWSLYKGEGGINSAIFVFILLLFCRSRSHVLDVY